MVLPQTLNHRVWHPERPTQKGRQKDRNKEGKKVRKQKETQIDRGGRKEDE